MILARVHRALATGESVERVAARFKISRASLFKHRLNHLQPNVALKQVLVSEERSGFDVVASSVDALSDTEAARARAADRGQTGIMLRAVAVQARDLHHAGQTQTQTPTQIAQQFNAEGVPTTRGGPRAFEVNCCFHARSKNGFGSSSVTARNLELRADSKDADS